MECMGEIVDRSLEHLAPSDRMIAITRKRLLEACQKLANEGTVPPLVDNQHALPARPRRLVRGVGQAGLARRLCRQAPDGAEPARPARAAAARRRVALRQSPSTLLAARRPRLAGELWPADRRRSAGLGALLPHRLPAAMLFCGSLNSMPSRMVGEYKLDGYRPLPLLDHAGCALLIPPHHHHPMTECCTNGNNELAGVDCAPVPIASRIGRKPWFCLWLAAFSLLGSAQ